MSKEDDLLKLAMDYASEVRKEQRTVRKDAVTTFVIAALSLIIQLAILGIVFMFAWNYVGSDLHLSTITFGDGVSFALLLRMVALSFYMGKEKPDSKTNA